MSRFTARACSCALIAACAAAGLADDFAPVRYDDHRLVQVALRTPADVQTMLEISPDHWSESVGVGLVPFRVPPERMPLLRASGLTFDVLHKNIQELIDAERSGHGAGDGGWFTAYKRHAQISAYVDTLVGLRGDLVTRLSLGQSLQGREIFGMQITGVAGPAGKPAVFFNGGQHAREWIGPMVNMYFADRLVRDYDSDPQVRAIMDRVVFLIVPLVNPDGFEYSWDFERMWRKNRRDNGGGVYGVDTNRNWGYEWGGAGSSGDPGSQTYRGTAPFSEPETQVVRDFILAHPEIKTHIDFHSYGQLILSPWSYSTGEPPEPARSAFRDLNTQMSMAIYGVHGKAYVAGPGGATLYLAAGVFPDWTHGERGILGWTIELRPNSGNPGFLLPPAEIIPTCQENFPVARILADYISLPLRFNFPSGLPALLEPLAPTDVDVEIIPVAGQLQPGSAKLFARLVGAGTFDESDLTPLGGNAYQATLPPVPCGQTLEFYFQAASTSGITITSPENAPTELYAAEAVQAVEIFLDDMELDRGWTVGAPGDTATSGIWNRMDPQGTAAQPEDDHTAPPGVICWVTDGRAGGSIGQYDVDNGWTTLNTPLLDLSSAADPVIGYWRWFSNNQGGSPNTDTFRIAITDDDGLNWTPVETVGPTGPQAGGGWYYHEFRVAGFAALTAEVRLRFVADDAGAGSIVEAAVDDFAIRDLGCPANCPADLNGDGLIDLADLGILLADFGCTAPGPCPGDIDGDGDTDLADLGILLSEFGNTCP